MPSHKTFLPDLFTMPSSTIRLRLSANQWANAKVAYRCIYPIVNLDQADRFSSLPAGVQASSSTFGSHKALVCHQAPLSPFLAYSIFTLKSIFRHCASLMSEIIGFGTRLAAQAHPSIFKVAQMTLKRPSRSPRLLLCVS